MKSLTFIILLLTLPLASEAKDTCLTPKKANMPKTADLPLPNTTYSIGFCYLADKVKAGGQDEFFHDLIVLKKDDKPIIKQTTKMSTSVGRINALKLEKTTDRFSAVSYEAGEYCNGIVIFDTEKMKVAYARSCTASAEICHIIELKDTNCKASMECQDGGAEGVAPSQATAVKSTIDLCK